MCIGSPTNPKKPKDDTPPDKDLRALFKDANIPRQGLSIKETIASLDSDAISKCIIANPTLAPTILGQYFNTEHLKLALEIRPEEINPMLSNLLGLTSLHKEKLSIYNEYKNTKLDPNSHEALLDVWIEQLPMRALVFHWLGMSPSQLIKCYSLCKVNFRFLIDVATCLPLLNHLRTLDASVLDEQEKSILKEIQEAIQ